MKKHGKELGRILSSAAYLRESGVERGLKWVGEWGSEKGDDIFAVPEITSAVLKGKWKAFTVFILWNILYGVI